jgi:catechol 2,3-dioxygenase-like lactoylglutathione lyase family enzyme
MTAAGKVPAIGPIVGVTISTPDLAASEAAYVSALGYRLSDRGLVNDTLATRWGCPAMAGARYITVHPVGGADCSIRLVQSPACNGYRAFSSFGWNAAELIVENVDALAEELAGSAFRILGPPQDLSFTDAIRAMQVRGPGGEILYLTQFKRDLPGLPAPRARCKVDRVFIVIVGGPSLEELLAFYTTRYDVPMPQRMESRVKAMSEAFGLSPEQRYPIAALPLRGDCYIEADQMPAAAQSPVIAPGMLPPGIGVVSFTGNSQRPASCARGPAGEIIEILPC